MDENREILELLHKLHSQYEALYRELLGNGQPGRIQRIEQEAYRVSERISKLERAKAYLVGLMGAIAFIVSILVRLIGPHL